MPTRSHSYALAVASGVLLALSFPKFGHPAIGWIALAPLVASLTGTTLRRALTLGLLTGVVSFTGTLYWITRVMVMYGDLQFWVAVLVNAALVLYLSLFPAFFALITRRLLIAYGRRALIAAPAVWVTTELGRTYLFTGFPWVLLGYSQVTVLPIAQLASVVGVYGVSMLVASVSVAAAATLVPGRRARGVRPIRRWWARQFLQLTPLHFAVLAVIAVAVWGARRAAGGELTRGDVIRVGLIQGNVSLRERSDPARLPIIFDNYLRMTRQAIAQGAELVIWPESATPFAFESDPASAARIRALAHDTKVPILLGSDQIAPGAGGVPTRYYNSAFLVRPDGTTGGAYRKMHLVPFGEYVPAKRVFFFAAPLVEAVSDFSAGEEATLLPVDAHKISTAICYEVVYPDLVRQFVTAGSELLTTITNDAWFGETSAPYQHFEQAAMRAIEEGRYLVRAANTGISGIVDPYGRVLDQTAIFQPAVVVGQVRFLQTSTFYSRHGDVLAYASTVATLALLVAASTVRSRRPPV
ncbi:MAG TPA: apolipoprotein N-acyltransferase [Vicinamibacterales bacterium]|nr:apolipoprotein N-acyltransferase [Vicinamibacterales bacterium]